DRVQRRGDAAVDRPRWWEVTPLDLLQGGEHVRAFERRPAGQQVIEGRAQAVDVAGRPVEVEPAGRLLRAHVRGRAEPRAGQGRAAAGRLESERLLRRPG